MILDVSGARLVRLQKGYTLATYWFIPSQRRQAWRPHKSNCQSMVFFVCLLEVVRFLIVFSQQ